MIMKIVHVVGTRPNFMKVAPLYSACAKEGFPQTLIHTGQHYDKNMSAIFFKEFGLPQPGFNLNVGSGGHAEQTGKIMMKLEGIIKKLYPDLVLVYGDCNSTLAAALTSIKLSILVAHVEAGLRSFDREMPEEINRLLTDQIADLLFTPSKEADENLLREGIDRKKIKLVGNIMIDTLIKLLPKARNSTSRKYWAKYKSYALVTLHRPSNVDDPKVLKKILRALGRISQKLPVIFPVHPRTQKQISLLDGFKKSPNFHLIDPLGYLEFLNLERQATVVITDSGGIQEETTFLGVPCFTLRKNTERPITVTLGTNIIIGSDCKQLEQKVKAILSGKVKKGKIPTLWDGHTAERIVKVLKKGCQ